MGIIDCHAISGFSPAQFTNHNFPSLSLSPSTLVPSLPSRVTPCSPPRSNATPYQPQTGNTTPYVRLTRSKPHPKSHSPCPPANPWVPLAPKNPASNGITHRQARSIPAPSILIRGHLAFFSNSGPPPALPWLPTHTLANRAVEKKTLITREDKRKKRSGLELKQAKRVMEMASDLITAANWWRPPPPSGRRG